MTADDFITHLRIEGVDQNLDDINVKLKAAFDHVERVSGMRFGADGTYKYIVYKTPYSFCQNLPVFPVLSIQAFQLESPTTTTITIDPSKYTLDNITQPNRILLKENWDASITIPTDPYSRTVINFTAGYDVSTIPPLAKECILLLTSDFYEYRIESITQRLNRIPMGLQRMLTSLSSGVYQ